ncbi:hypothetical protein EIP91_004808 [Steccherinum ochraceum]|uniref:Membrane anchor Opy2 N-terminal domain-containing protein n=1 Tax=Steccherinum ochraceum TaxID=92696 RepID=A0A4R0RGE6_9APHY|nr:hypothetical protein EIP91_004808 [Steccherinum ochraceum]
MSISLLRRCIQCADPAPCSNCAANEQCVLVNRDCNTCSVNKCVPVPGSGSKGGVSAGAVAGAVIAAVLFLVVAILAFLWYRRRQRRIAAARSTDVDKVEIPARAEDVLNRPDPNEKPPSPLPTPTIRGTLPYGEMVAMVSGQGSSAVGTQGHTPRASQQSNPFEDRLDTQSIQTAGSVGTQSNVIPIHLVGPDAASARSNPTTVPSTQATAGSAPSRPDRDPSLNLNTDPNATASADTNRAASPYSASQISANVRHSYMSTGSYASDLLGEAPIIVTPGRGAVKQVLGVVKAEVIRTPPGSSVSGDSPPSSADSLRPTFASRPPARSPLAASSFGPADMLKEVDEEHAQDVEARQDPFGDEHSPYINESSSQASPASPTPSASTFGSPAPTPSQYVSSPATEVDWSPEDPSRPWASGSKTPRPESISTQAGSVIGASIGAATRMHVGHILAPPSTANPDTPLSAALSSPRTPYRMTSAKLVSPVRQNDDASPASVAGGAFEMQQRRALQEMDVDRRESRTSMMSSVSEADSILGGFPFVPPSPISDRPVRTPPRSPLAQQAFSDNSTVTTPHPQQTDVAQSQQTEESSEQRTRKKSSQPPPPALFNNRKMLGLSVASETSTMSNGLGSFPFQIDTGSITEATASSSGPAGPQTVDGRQRASLDTLALTSDLASYPLGLDQNLMDHYPGPKR